MMDFMLTDQQKDIQKVAKEFARVFKENGTKPEAELNTNFRTSSL